MTARAAAGGSFSARGHKRRCRGIDCPKTKAKGGRAYDRKNASAPLGARTGKTPRRRADKAKHRRRKPPQGTADLRRVAASFSASDRLRRAVCLARAAQARAAGESFGLPRYACPMLVRDADFTEAFSAIGHAVAAPDDSRSPSAMPTSLCLAAAVSRTPRRSAAGRRSHSRTEQTRRMPQPSPCRIMCSTRSRRCPFPMCHRSTAR